MRKAKPKKRIILPDPKFGEVMLTQFVNNLMIDGKKSIAFSILYDALDLIAPKAEKEEKTVVEYFKKALENDDPESKIMNVLREICDGVIGKMMEKTVMHMCVPEGMPDELMGLMMMLGGGMPMMNLSEMMDMFGPDDDDEEDDED